MAEVVNMLGTLAFLFCIAVVKGIPEQGKWVYEFTEANSIFGIRKSMFNKTMISVKIECTSDASPDLALEFDWLLRYSPCAEEYSQLSTSDDNLTPYLQFPGMQMIKEFSYKEFSFIKNQEYSPEKCSELVSFHDYTKRKPTIKFANALKANLSGITTQKGQTTLAPTLAPVKSPAGAGPAKSSDSKPSSSSSSTSSKERKKRALTNDPVKAAPAVTTPVPNNTPPPEDTKLPAGDKSDKHNFLQTWQDGNYLFVLQMNSDQNKPFKATGIFQPYRSIAWGLHVTIEMIGPHGYISAQDWPLLIFFGLMGIVYLIYGIAWLVMLACSWRDLLRVQFWIGGVIALGMLEKAVFYTEYQTIANTGQSVQGAVLFAELVSSLKKTIARMLVIIVSLGFGIVKPRLGPVFKKVVGVGIFYLLVSTIEGCMRQLQSKGDTNKNILAAQVPLALTDASICWWIFSSLVQTTRTLRLRRNVVKLSLYRHFTNTLIFAVLASVVYMIWSLSQHKMKICITDWRELWVDEAFWHLLFSVILLVIMVLWRPSVNNQRYAFSPLLDAADDEDEEEQMIHDAFDGMKMRGVKDAKQANGSPKQGGRSTIEDDLKWVEDNIPSSIADKTLPSLLDDSDEEILTAKYEVNKMQ